MCRSKTIAVSGYYERRPTTFVDGSSIFKTPCDEKSENEVAGILEGTWNCEARSLGKLAAIDWVFVRDGRLVGIGELKSRTHDSRKYTTVFLNLRKWLALTLSSVGLGVPAVFVVKFTDGVYYTKINSIDVSKVKLGGCHEIVKSRNDVEPVIEVPCSSLLEIQRF